jgi:hypothetical protein
MSASIRRLGESRRRTVYASLGETARSPIGWVEFCAEIPAIAAGGASQPRDIVMSQTAWRDLAAGQQVGQRDHQADHRHGSLGCDREMVVADGRLR